MVPRKKSPITDPLREAIVKSKLPLLVIERETGVKRQSIMWFVRGERSLRLDMADKLAAYFGLTLRGRPPRKQSRPGRGSE